MTKTKTTTIRKGLMFQVRDNRDPRTLEVVHVGRKSGMAKVRNTETGRITEINMTRLGGPAYKLVVAAQAA